MSSRSIPSFCHPTLFGLFRPPPYLRAPLPSSERGPRCVFGGGGESAHFPQSRNLGNPKTQPPKPRTRSQTPNPSTPRTPNSPKPGSHSKGHKKIPLAHSNQSAQPSHAPSPLTSGRSHVPRLDRVRKPRQNPSSNRQDSHVSMGKLVNPSA